MVLRAKSAAPSRPSDTIAVIECQIQLCYISSSSTLIRSIPFSLLEGEMDETTLERARAGRVLDTH